MAGSAENTILGPALASGTIVRWRQSEVWVPCCGRVRSGLSASATVRGWIASCCWPMCWAWTAPLSLRARRISREPGPWSNSMRCWPNAAPEGPWRRSSAGGSFIRWNSRLPATCWCPGRRPSCWWRPFATASIRPKGPRGYWTWGPGAARWPSRWRGHCLNRGSSPRTIPAVRLPSRGATPPGWRRAGCASFGGPGTVRWKADASTPSPAIRRTWSRPCAATRPCASSRWRHWTAARTACGNCAWSFPVRRRTSIPAECWRWSTARTRARRSVH